MSLSLLCLKGTLLFAICSFPLWCSLAHGQQHPHLDLIITGLDELHHNNVYSHLSLISYPDDELLSEQEFLQLYAKADDEIFSALQPFGYYSPVINGRYFKEEASWKVRFHIDPGKPVRMAKIIIEVKGPGSDDPEVMKSVKLFPLQQGDLLDHRRYTRGKQDLINSVLGKGYQEVIYSTSTIEVIKSEFTAQLHLVLETGPRYFFGPITYKCDFLDHELLRKIAPYAQGDPFSARALTRLRQALLNSDYFKDAQVVFDIDKAVHRHVPVTVELTPKLRNKYGFGGGYGTDTGLRGFVEWSNRRLNRYGHQVEIEVQPSERKSHLGGVYTIPIRDPKKDRIALLGKWENENFDNTESQSWTATLGYDHLRDIGEYSIYLTYLREDYDAGLDTGQATLLTPGIRAIWRIADDRIVTSQGISLAASITGAHQSEISDTTFFQGTLRGKAIVSFLESWRFVGRMEFGGTIVDNMYDLPPSLRFYAGGDQSVRGYGYKRIGPTDSDGNVIGGQYLYTYSLEIERTLFDHWGAALFFDSGTAMNSLSEFTMQHGAGVGVRWNAPFGQFRLDLAKKVNQGSNEWRLHLNIGADL